MPPALVERRMLFVHAHPDDESITTGATMAAYAASGAEVTLVTCTRGERGEIIPPELTDLTGGDGSALGRHRVGELAAAMAELGVVDHRFLGEPHRRYRDSGMVWGGDGRRAVAPSAVDPESLWAADLRAAADDLIPLIRELRPQVVVTYDDNGGYGHPDHIQTHRVTTYAVDLAAVTGYRTDLGPAWDVPKLYWITMPRSVVQRGMETMEELGSSFGRLGSPDDLGHVVADHLVTAVVDGSAYVERKAAAMRAHATQIVVESPFFALSDGIGQGIWGHEYFRLARGKLGPIDPETGREDDLFAGLDH